jgi:hypothetical protein
MARTVGPVSIVARWPSRQAPYAVFAACSPTVTATAVMTARRAIEPALIRSQSAPSAPVITTRKLRR